MRIEHEYIAHCDFDTEMGASFINLLILLVFLYLTLGFFWVMHMTIFEIECTNLQRSMVSILLLKLILCVVEGIYVSQCPWKDHI